VHVTVDMVVALVVMVAVVVVLARERYAPAPTMLAGLVVLTIAGVVPADQAFAGFSSSATLTIAGLFVVARALQVHAGLGAMLSRLLGGAARDRVVLGRLVAPVLLASSVIANTPLVATLGPMVRTWSERHGRAPSTFLMPLSFAALLGGVITTIGTSTTLVVSGIVVQQGLDPFSFFEVLPLGLPVALVGGVLLVLLAPRVLPDRRPSYAQVASHERDYTFRLQVATGGPLDGHTVTDSGLRNLEQVYVAGLRRGDLELTPLAPSTVLQSGDVLTFVGRVQEVLEVSSRSGLVHADETQATLLDGDRHGLVEAVVGTNSPLVNRTPKEVAFRGHYGAAIVAIHRQGERVDAKLGEVRLAAGDALLLMTDEDFEERWRPTRDFAVVVPLDDDDARPSRYRPLVGATTVAMVVAAAVGVPILTAVLAACLVLVGSRAIRFWDARGSVDLDVLLIVASAIGLGGAIASSGLAEQIGDLIEAVASSSGSLVALLAVLVGTLVLTELVTNVAAAALMVPIAVDVAARVGEDPRGWAVGVAVMASSSFLTPIGYQTNTIVYGLGGYRFGDYWRLGLPLTTIVLVAGAVLIPLLWG
jgi:di/tricarboxylate transporter